MLTLILGEQYAVLGLIFTGATTINGYLIGTSLPRLVKAFCPPLLVSAGFASASCALWGKIAGISYEGALRMYLGSVRFLLECHVSILVTWRTFFLHLYSPSELALVDVTHLLLQPHTHTHPLLSFSLSLVLFFYILYVVTHTLTQTRMTTLICWAMHLFHFQQRILVGLANQPWRC